MSALNTLISWFETTIGASTAWSMVGVGATFIAALFGLWIIAKISMKIARLVARKLQKTRRENAQGYCIGVTPLSGLSQKAGTKPLSELLRQHLKHFCFGAPYQVIDAPFPVATRKFGLRATARRWLDRSAADMVIWGGRRKSKTDPIDLDILSCEGSLTAQEARFSQASLPNDLSDLPEIDQKACAYLIARTLQPGLATATTFRIEKLQPVAEILANILNSDTALPESARAVIETDYCAMALHIGGLPHLEQVTSLRQRRLLKGGLSTQQHIEARIDLGRALLGISEKKFDPNRIREAMDHLKAARDLLAAEPVLRMATATTEAVQRGQQMLATRRRFSVTGGGI